MQYPLMVLDDVSVQAVMISCLKKKTMTLPLVMLTFV